MENALLKAQEKVEKEALKKYKANPDQAIKFITQYSNEQANKAYLQTVGLLNLLEIPLPNTKTKTIKIKDDVPVEN